MSGKQTPADKERRARRFEALFRATHARVLAYAVRRAADREMAEEVVSETFLVAWRRFDAVPGEPLPWLLGTARKILANQRRAARRRAPDGPDASLDGIEIRDSAPPISESLAERDAFAKAFAALGDRDREVLSLLAWDGLRVQEAAKVVGCSAAVFSLRAHRARRRLLKELHATGHSLGEGEKRPPLAERPGTTEGR
ncbi:MAG TPA: sigma-70 family RNA polymerase sigma factor [Solirubrobacterales bacterium]|nr:sigma-70 family RNA polymerase sigma factor [Solirubrobacterales bacterium]